MKSNLLGLIICIIAAGKAYSQADRPSPLKNTKMKQYSLLVRVPDTYTAENARTAGPQWDKVLEQWKTDGVYVLSFAFPGEGYTITGKEKKVRKETVFSDNLRVVSNIVLQAETMEHALELAKTCPVLLYGGKVEVREIPKPVKPSN